MDHNQFFSALAGGNLEKCYLFEGPQEFIKHSALDAVCKVIEKGDFPEMNMNIMKDPSADAIIAACETLPFMSEKRLVIVKECTMLSAEKKANDHDDTEIDSLKAYLPQLPQTTCLVFYVRGKADGRKKLYNVLKKSAAIVAFDSPSEEELVKWIAVQCKKNGKKIDRDTCTRLFFTCGRDLNTLSNEISKLCAYTAEREEITPADIAAMCSETLEYRVFDLAELLFSGQGKKALQMLQGLLRSGEERLMLLSLLGRHARQLMYAAYYRDKYTAASALGVPSFAAEKLINQSRLYKKEQLKAICDRCVKTEYEIKSGDIPENGALETLMLWILAIRSKA